MCAQAGKQEFKLTDRRYQTDSKALESLRRYFCELAVNTKYNNPFLTHARLKGFNVNLVNAKLTDLAADIIEGLNFGHLATLMPDGSPQVTPVWVDHDDGFILINTAVGRVKQRNVTRDPRVAIDVIDQNNPYRKVCIRGRVVDQIREGADEHIDMLAHKYLGVEKYQHRQPGEQRVILKIEPDHVSS